MWAARREASARRVRSVVGMVAVAALVGGLPAGCGGDDGRGRPTEPAARGDGGGHGAARRAPRTVARDLEVPWGVAVLPGGDALVAERDRGQIVRIPARGGRARPVGRVPGVQPTGEGGLLGLARSPRFARDRLVYAYLTTATDNRIVRFALPDSAAERELAVTPVLTGLRQGPVHDGGRIAFGPDGKLYATVGEVGETALAQDRRSRNGKILRMEPDGGVPADNPFRGSLVYSLGHRNPQGIAWDGRGRLWAAEFGQDRWDEVNLIRPGRNYGWPVVEGRGDTRGGRFVDPVAQWPTDEASPSGIAIVGQTLYMATLQGQMLRRLRLRGTRARELAPLLRGRHGRLRTVVGAPGRRVWVTTSNRDGRGSPADGDDRILSLPAG